MQTSTTAFFLVSLPAVSLSKSTSSGSAVYSFAVLSTLALALSAMASVWMAAESPR